MRRTDARRRGLDGSLTGPSAKAHPAAPPPESVPHRKDNPIEDRSDEEVSNWESAWIDLGGEG